MRSVIVTDLSNRWRQPGFRADNYISRVRQLQKSFSQTRSHAIIYSRRRAIKNLFAEKWHWIVPILLYFVEKISDDMRDHRMIWLIGLSYFRRIHLVGGKGTTFSEITVMSHLPWKSSTLLMVWTSVVVMIWNICKTK